ncbi:MAG: DUF4149 domain-containing protein [Zetaproteobacteria bacterium CG12_big_fil_rev_8_21_14_0_65_54_13]|nr:MAG: hypothetical protein COX55_08315 [Zetaproteobacteria bacterium CG23_combo_of_CG06-09_8_20_14_all_54_7]PIW51409.1 MAG: DUF4149 domain-containing protein [Zetaproteobacteria bacterium CG12_big_fil_rev_8_21_14_0_65_54_13]PIX55730.1 MAG: DUF4149 domain-containing protein [Zetaproteobacteria bacterium CG_4_10_14_3_um_filter_54_28]PJA30542.1 MAG: DUF4149 domain-containing protein [Zetaproteobacteria bacterium CG_4_9_14_3_um_filter_54_145]
MSVACIRIGAVRLCLAMMLALLIVPGYIVAPVLFSAASSQAVAGELAGKVFHISMISLLFMAAAVAAFWMRMQAEQIGLRRWLLLLVVVLLVAVNAFALAPIMADIKAQMGPIDLVAKDDPQRQLFGMWHGISAVLHLLASLVTALLVALGPVGRAQVHKPS